VTHRHRRRSLQRSGRRVRPSPPVAARPRGLWLAATFPRAAVRDHLQQARDASGATTGFRPGRAITAEIRGFRPAGRTPSGLRHAATAGNRPGQHLCGPGVWGVQPLSVRQTVPVAPLPQKKRKKI